MIAVSDERTGRRIARLFRKMRALPRDSRTFDLEGVLAADCIDMQESWCPNPAYTACLLQVGDGIPAGILLAGGQARGRKRFSIAHELGHLYIPTHANRPLGWCTESAMIAHSGLGDQMEWEANDFAAELLMPQHLLARDAAQVTPAFGSMTDLVAGSDQYDVSVTAAGVRYVKLTRSACALVSSRNGVIEWVIGSESFAFRIPRRGDRVPESSVAASEVAVHEAQQLAPEVWLEYAQRTTIELFESTHCVPSLSQTLSLLWVEEASEWE